MKSSSTAELPTHARGESRHALRDGTVIVIRPIQATDIELERDFIERLSPQSRRFRFLGSLKTPSPELLRQFTHPQLTGGVAYVALVDDASGTREIGVSRYSATEDSDACECAVAVSDEWQGKGLATMLLHRLIETARDHGFQRMYSIDAADNQEMRMLAAHLGFKSETHPDDPTMVLNTLTLSNPGGKTSLPVAMNS